MFAIKNWWSVEQWSIWEQWTCVSANLLVIYEAKQSWSHNVKSHLQLVNRLKEGIWYLLSSIKKYTAVQKDESPSKLVEILAFPNNL